MTLIVVVVALSMAGIAAGIIIWEKLTNKDSSYMVLSDK